MLATTVSNMVVASSKVDLIAYVLGELLHSLQAQRACIGLGKGPYENDRERFFALDEGSKTQPTLLSDKATKNLLEQVIHSSLIVNTRLSSFPTICMPIISRSGTIGALMLERPAIKQPFDAEDQAFLSIIACHLGTLSEKHELEKTLHYVAEYDHLTTLLPNQMWFWRRLETLIDSSTKLKTMVAIFFMDSDNFEKANERYGHRFGDKALYTIAQRLKEAVPPTSMLARMSGDEFGLIKEVESVEEARHIAVAVVEAFRKPIVVQEQQLTVTFSVGISIFPLDGQAPVDLLDKADRALYMAKQHGKNCFKLFNPDIRL